MAQSDSWYKSSWARVAGLLRDAALEQQRGVCVLTINVLVGRDGDPVFVDGEPLLWTEPRLTKLEPKAQEVVALLRELAQP
jgi:hypothetical protein